MSFNQHITVGAQVVDGTYRSVKLWNNSDSTQSAIFNNRTYIFLSINVSFIVVCTLE